jgi:hypothetical protein
MNRIPVFVRAGAVIRRRETEELRWTSSLTARKQVAADTLETVRATLTRVEVREIMRGEIRHANR